MLYLFQGFWFDFYNFYKSLFFLLSKVVWMFTVYLKCSFTNFIKKENSHHNKIWYRSFAFIFIPKIRMLSIFVNFHSIKLYISIENFLFYFFNI